MKINNAFLFHIYKYLYLIPKGIIEFKNERLLIGGKLKTESNESSIIFFTTHKCASKFFHQFFNDIANQSYLKKFNFDEYILRYAKYDLQDTLYYEHGLEKGCIFAPIRRFEKFKNIHNYKVILAIRDPRDVLVSYYYSTLYSHDVSSTSFLSHRKKFENHDIDSFVIENSNWLFKTLDQYKNNLASYHYIKYDELINNSLDTIKKLLNFMSVDMPQEKIQQYVKDLSPSEATEKFKHKRSGLSGQFSDHLKPETVNALNNKFKKILEYYNFEI